MKAKWLYLIVGLVSLNLGIIINSLKIGFYFVGIYFLVLSILYQVTEMLNKRKKK